VRRVVVAGAGGAATTIARHAAEAGVAVGWARRNRAPVTVPDRGVLLTVSSIVHPTPTDATTLTDADLVVCQALPSADAATVGATLGLSDRTTDWLTRVDPDIVALIGRGEVRWATIAPHGFAGLVGLERT
jgi:cation diffusion facilitator CzcD-associated flavoprotein CzcO